jgi:oligopeptide transport system permease protein
MLSYIFKRIGLALVTMLFVICITFLLMNTVPGGPFLSEKAISPQTLAALEAKYGLDKPLHVQLWNYIVSILHGDFGVSLKMQKNRPVATIIMEMFPTSARIGIIAISWAFVAGTILGCLAAFYRRRPADNIIQVIITVGISLPGFVVATSLLVAFAGGVLKIFPTAGLTKGPIAYVLPCFVLGLGTMCAVARYTRNSMLDVLGKEYIKTAKAYGHNTNKVIYKYALRNALIPVITYLGPAIAGILTGGFVVEQVFSIPGLGRYFIQSINNRDYPLIMGTTIFLATLVIVMNLVVDILYKLVDPRIELANESE